MDRHAQTFHDMLTHTKKSQVNFHNASATEFSKNVSMKVFEISGILPNS